MVGNLLNLWGKIKNAPNRGIASFQISALFFPELHMEFNQLCGILPESIAVKIFDPHMQKTTKE